MTASGFKLVTKGAHKVLDTEKITTVYSAYGHCEFESTSVILNSLRDIEAYWLKLGRQAQATSPFLLQGIYLH